MSYANPALNLYRQSRPRTIESGGRTIHSPTDYQLSVEEWMPESFDALGPYQRHGAPIVGEYAVRYTAEDLPLEAVAEIKRAEIAAARWAAETGGIDWLHPSTGQAERIATDRESQGKMTAMVLLGQPIPTWKTATGRFISLTVEDVAAMGQAAAAWVGACFARESVLSAAIDGALANNDRAALIAVTWSNG